MASGLRSGWVLPIAATCIAIGCGDSGAAISTCATTATPDLTVQGGFDVDTGLTSPSMSSVGAAYGQSACEGQYLVEVDLQAIAGADFVTTGFWSAAVPAEPCDERATMNVFVFDGTRWQSWDVVAYVAKVDGTICYPSAVSHVNAASDGLDATNIPGARQFQKARIAVRATQAGAPAPVAVVGQVFRL